MSLPEAPARTLAAGYREVRFEHSPDLPGILAQLGVSLLISTYQAGKVLVLGVVDDKVALSFHNLEQPMGMAVTPRTLALGTRRLVWFLNASADLAPRPEPAGRYQGVYLTRSAFFTGSIHCHDMAWCGSGLWIVNKLFSCLAPLRPPC